MWKCFSFDTVQEVLPRLFPFFIMIYLRLKKNYMQAGFFDNFDN